MISSPNSAALLSGAEAFAREELGPDTTGHDYWHARRVVRLTERIGREEGADLLVCGLAAWLHDVADYKIAGSDEEGMRRVAAWLKGQGVEEALRRHVLEIVGTMSFAGGGRPPMATLEGRVVQDADRLDALGAIGIARTFAFGGAHHRPLYDPAEPPRRSMSTEEYRANRGSSLNHFYEKLLLLRERINTAAGRRLAEERHRYLEEFVERFLAEWEGMG